MKDGKHVVLYVEDDPDSLAALGIVLETNGYMMVQAPSAEEGLKVYKETKPDFVLVDLMMEEVDAGASFVKELKALGCRAPIYILSSIGDALDQTINTSELGVTGVFQKPLALPTLLRTLETHLG